MLLPSTALAEPLIIIHRYRDSSVAPVDDLLQVHGAWCVLLHSGQSMCQVCSFLSINNLIHCCFKVLDECYRVLREVVVHKNPPKSYELLQELRDISSMAMEHFEEHIVPTLKRHQTLANALRPRPFTRDADGESDSSESLLNSPLSHLISPATAGTSRSNALSALMPQNFKFEVLAQQNRLIINNQRREIAELKAKVSKM